MWPNRGGGRDKDAAAGPPIRVAGGMPTKTATCLESEVAVFIEFFGRNSRIRTYDLCLPKAALYQAELYSEGC